MTSTRRTLLLIALAAVLPVAAAYGWYYFGPKGRRINYGELVETRPLPDAALTTLDGQPLRFSSLRGKWLLLQVDTSDCDADCRGKLYDMRQVRTAQGKNQERIERVWLLTDGGTPAASLIEEYRGTVILRAAGSPLVASLPARDTPRGHLYVVDPLGNVVLRYPTHADGRGILRDMERLLRASRIG